MGSGGGPQSWLGGWCGESEMPRRAFQGLARQGDEAMAAAVQVFDLDMGGLGQAQAAAIDGHQEGAGAQIAVGADGEQTFDLGDAEGARDAGLALGPLDVAQEGFDVLVEQPAVKGAQGIECNIDSGGRELTLGD